MSLTKDFKQQVGDEPPVPVMVRTSERTLFTKCRMAWWWSYKERREPTETWSRALIFGDMVHRSLADYYIPETRKARKRGRHPAQTFIKLYDIMDANGKAFGVRTDDEFWIDAADLGCEMLENYIDHWRAEDKDILVLYPEMPFQYPIYDPATGLLLCTYVGTTDALIRRISTGKLGLFENKTAAQITTDHLFLDEQASSYWCIIPLWLLENEIIKPTDNMDFMLYNFLRKAVKDDRPQNAAGQYLNLPSVETLRQAVLAANEYAIVKGATRDMLMDMLRQKGINPLLLGEVSKSQPPPLFQREVVYRGKYEQQMTMQRIVEQVREMNAVRNGIMAHYKAPSKDCSFCQWKDICELHETGTDWKELKRVTTRKWSPYAAHIWSIDVDAA